MKKRHVCAAALACIMIANSVASVPGPATVQAASTPAVTEIPDTDRTMKDALDASFFSVTGFADGKVNDRSQYKEGDEEYAVVTNEDEFLAALESAQEGITKVIEIRNNLYLGWYEISEDARSYYDGIIIPYDKSLTLTGSPISNPSMIESGVSQVQISNIDGLTIFSKNGNNIEHAEFKLAESANDIVIRNLKFYNTWDYDDQRSSGYGVYGQLGTTKRSGWSCMKINGATNVWLDHCDFGIAYDGCVDVENGAHGVSITWCDIGDQDYSKGSMLYKAMAYMDYLYNRNKEDSSVGTFRMYKIMRDNGMTNEDIMRYIGQHSKCHLGGGGDTDSWYFSSQTEKFLGGEPDKSRTNANEYLRMTFAYNNWYNIGSRVPLIRGGVGHLFNCYMDDTGIAEARDQMRSTKNAQGRSISDQIGDIDGGVHFLLRGMNARNGAAIAADTNVYYNVDQPIVGAENDYKDQYYKNEEWAGIFGYNHSLIVNSKITNSSGQTYTGSSWDNNGDNLFMSYGYWTDKSTINNWSWLNEGDKLSYSYQTFPLEDVEHNVKTYGGAYTLDMSAKDWLRVDYDASETIKTVDPSVDVPLETLTLSKETATLYIEEEFLQLDARMYPAHTTESDDDFTWTSSNPEVATVLDAGLVIPKKLGTTTITVTSKSGKTASCDVTVTQFPTSITISNLPENIYVGDIINLDTDVKPDVLPDHAVTWANAGVRATLLDESKGIFRFEKEGNNPVQVTSNVVGNRVGSTSLTKKVTLKILANPNPVVGITTVSNSLSVETGASIPVNAATSPVDATNPRLRYSVADASVAAVSADGTITGLNEGSTTVTVTSVNGGYTADIEITVTAPSQKPDPTPDPVMTGDVDDNKKIELADAQAALKIALKIISDPTDRQLTAADIDQNDKVELSDAQAILKEALKITTNFK